MGALSGTDRGSPTYPASKKKKGWQDDSNPAKSVFSAIKDVGGSFRAD